MKSSFHGHLPPDSLAAGIPKIHISACYGYGFSDVDTGPWNRIKPLQHKKRVFSLVVFPCQRLNPMTVLWLGPTDAATLREGHTGKSAAFLGCTICYLWKGEEQEAAGQTFREICRRKSRSRPCRDTAAALEQDTE